MQVAVSVVGGGIGSTLAVAGNTSLAVETIFWSFLAATTAGILESALYSKILF